MGRCRVRPAAQMRPYRMDFHADEPCRLAWSPPPRHHFPAVSFYGWRFLPVLAGQTTGAGQAGMADISEDCHPWSLAGAAGADLQRPSPVRFRQLAYRQCLGAHRPGVDVRRVAFHQNPQDLHSGRHCRRHSHRLLAGHVAHSGRRRSFLLREQLGRHH